MKYLNIIAFICLLIAFICLGSLQSRAQISVALKTEINSQKLVIRNGKYTVGDKTYRYRNLEEQFTFSKEGLNLYHKSKKDMRSGKLFSLAAVGTFVVAGALAINNYKANEAAYWLTLGSGFTESLISIPFFSKARKKMRHAIFIRNKDLILGNTNTMTTSVIK